MSPRHKAINLLYKFSGIMAVPVDQRIREDLPFDNYTRKRALICCDEIIEAMNVASARGRVEYEYIEGRTPVELVGGIEYWQQVKSEISKL